MARALPGPLLCYKSKCCRLAQRLALEEEKKTDEEEEEEEEEEELWPAIISS